MNAVTVADSLAVLNSVDFSDVSIFLQEREGYSEKDVQSMESEYKRFIALRVSRPKTIMAISDKVDPYWHAHIIFTRHYKHACERLGVPFIHHNPPTKEDIAALKLSYLENTLKSYEDEFGALNEEWWPKSADAAVCSDNFSWSPEL